MSEPVQGAHDVHVRLPFARESARAARDLVDGLIVDQGVSPEFRQDAALVVHELVINAVLHGRPSPEAELELGSSVEDDALFVSVLDWGRGGSVAVKPPSQDAPNGRGLAIVEALCTSWTVDRSVGTRVSAWLPLRRADEAQASGSASR